jgi:hypothetical protein
MNVNSSMASLNTGMHKTVGYSRSSLPMINAKNRQVFNDKRKHIAKVAPVYVSNADIKARLTTSRVKFRI